MTNEEFIKELNRRLRLMVGEPSAYGFTLDSSYSADDDGKYIDLDYSDHRADGSNWYTKKVYTESFLDHLMNDHWED